MANKVMVIGAAAMLITAVAHAGEGEAGWWKRTFGTLNWEEVVSAVSSPSEVARRVRHHVDFRDDVGDQWAEGKETWDRGYGDCEDMAAAVVAMCKRIGIDATVMVFCPTSRRAAHAVAVGKWNGKMWISSNGWYETVKSMDDAKREIAKEMGWRGLEIDIWNLSEESSTMVAGRGNKIIDSRQAMLIKQ
jgi:hypothetical protein